jgi:hypothetical protein
LLRAAYLATLRDQARITNYLAIKILATNANMPASPASSPAPATSSPSPTDSKQ